MKRRKFSADFKRKVVVRAMRADRTVRATSARPEPEPGLKSAAQAHKLLPWYLPTSSA